MDYTFLSIMASVLVVIGYLPEFYSIIKNKSKDVGNIYIWIIWTTSSSLSVIYCILIEEYYVMVTNIIILLMNFLTFLLKYYYLHYYKEIENEDLSQDQKV